MAILSPFVFWQLFDNNGDALNGGKLYTYEAGTSTPKATYTAQSGTVANTNPIILDASGRADICVIAGKGIINGSITVIGIIVGAILITVGIVTVEGGGRTTVGATSVGAGIVRPSTVRGMIEGAATVGIMGTIGIDGA